mmetsp:Transcript_48619/g.150599  ORF Transcript_48619/g.150599 Transcript_48619/m.150599 type:complete len:316 (+) Transcript_48619:266-1213(+)
MGSERLQGRLSPAFPGRSTALVRPEAACARRSHARQGPAPARRRGASARTPRHANLRRRKKNKLAERRTWHPVDSQDQSPVLLRSPETRRAPPTSSAPHSMLRSSSSQSPSPAAAAILRPRTGIRPRLPWSFLAATAAAASAATPAAALSSGRRRRGSGIRGLQTRDRAGGPSANHSCPKPALGEEEMSAHLTPQCMQHHSFLDSDQELYALPPSLYLQSLKWLHPSCSCRQHHSCFATDHMSSQSRRSAWQSKRAPLWEVVVVGGAVGTEVATGAGGAGEPGASQPTWKLLQQYSACGSSQVSSELPGLPGLQL